MISTTASRWVGCASPKTPPTRSASLSATPHPTSPASGSSSTAAARSEHAWTSTDALLYALGVGAGVVDPVGSELEFTTENSIGVTQKVLPTLGVVLATGGEAFGLAGTFDPAMAVHGEQGIELAGPLPPEGRVITTSRLTGIYDKGAGAIVT